MRSLCGTSDATDARADSSRFSPAHHRYPRGSNLAHESKVVTSALSLMLAGCVHLPDHQPVSWCESVKPLFTREGVTCLELAGSYSLTFFGPHSAPKRYSLAPCADGGAQPSRATENIGDYSTNYSYERKFDGAASLSLKGLTGLGWAPD